MEREGRKLLMNLLEKYVEDGMELLEVGCGNGDIMEKVEENFGVEAICADPYGHGKNVFHVRAEELSSLGKKFDIVYSLQSLHHFLSLEKFLNEGRRIMRKNGKIILVDWKKGVDTGIPERYFSLEEVKEKVEKLFRIIERGEGEFPFYIVGLA